jgi:hypothetical protein
MSVLGCQVWSWRAVAFSAGGDGARKPPELPAGAICTHRLRQLPICRREPYKKGGLKPSVLRQGLFCPKFAACRRSLEFARLRTRSSPKALGRFLRPRAFFVACLIGRLQPGMQISTISAVRHATGLQPGHNPHRDRTAWSSSRACAVDNDSRPETAGIRRLRAQHSAGTGNDMPTSSGLTSTRSTSTFWEEPEQGIGILIVFAAMHHLYKLTVELS